MRWYLLLTALVALGVGCGGSDSSPTSTEVNFDTYTTTSSGLQYKDLIAGSGEKARQGATAVVHYTGWLLDGTKFDSSLDQGTPFEFVIGTGQVIKGWDQGLLSMCAGERRRLTIPSGLGYGDRGSPPRIPGGATLVFDVELIDF